MSLTTREPDQVFLGNSLRKIYAAADKQYKKKTIKDCDIGPLRHFLVICPASRLFPS